MLLLGIFALRKSPVFWKSKPDPTCAKWQTTTKRDIALTKTIRMVGGGVADNHMVIGDEDVVSADCLSVMNSNGDIILRAPSGRSFVDEKFEQFLQLDQPAEEIHPSYETALAPRRTADGGKTPIFSHNQIRLFQVAAAVIWIAIVGGMNVIRALNPNVQDFQAVADVTYHPIASAMGALFPSVVLALPVYWGAGIFLRRLSAHYKRCEHCISSIKVDASVCRYCRRDLAH